MYNVTGIIHFRFNFHCLSYLKFFPARYSYLLFLFLFVNLKFQIFTTFHESQCMLNALRLERVENKQHRCFEVEICAKKESCADIRLSERTRSSLFLMHFSKLDT
jgi:hypothetical protein